MRKAVDSSALGGLSRYRSIAIVVSAVSAFAVGAAPLVEAPAVAAGEPPPGETATPNGPQGLPGKTSALFPTSVGFSTRSTGGMGGTPLSPLMGESDPSEPGGPARAIHPWRVIDGKYWQIVTTTPGEDPRVTDAREGNRGSCAPGMIEVAGRMKDDSGDYFGVDGRQQLTCKKWISREWPERCAEYDRDAWLEKSKDIKTTPMHFCIDRFEYPNRAGEYPIVLVDWNEANALCKKDQKRLCSEDEWTFACEGEEARPYPNGYSREADACVNDRTWREFKAFGRRDGSATMLELDRLWQGEPSGSRPKCKSAFGVYDMTGNIDEWTRSSRPGERPSVLKGGYWGPVRTRCRPATKAHGETHVFYQEGLRCCSDAPSSGPVASRAMR